MASGSYQSNTGVNCNIKLMWSSQPDAASNTSTVTVTVQLLHHALYMGIRTLNIHCMGLSKSVAVPAISTGATSLVTTTIGNVTFTVPHNADGTMSGTISAEMPQFNVTYGDKYLASLGCSGTATLDTIPRASQLTLSADRVEMAKKLTITINRASEAFAHSLYYYFGELMYEPIPAEIVDDVCVWTVPRSLGEQIPNATEGKGKILLETYNSEGVLVGAVTKEFTAYLNPEYCKPFVEDVIPTGRYSDVFGFLIQGKSELNVEAVVNTFYGADLASLRITANGGTYTYNNCNAGILKNAGEQEIVVEATDSRGLVSDAESIIINVVEYASPVISKLKAFRCDANGNADDEGEYINITAVASISPLEDQNDVDIVLEWKPSDGDYEDIDSTSTGYEYNKNIIVPASPDNMYTVRLAVSDYFTTVTYTAVVPTAYTLMDFNATGKGIAFGKVSEQNAFECAMPATMERAWFGYVPEGSEFYTNDAGYKGRVFSTNWFASVGATGWYNDTYKGGWYMSDASWIRAYGDKNIYTARMMYAGQLKTVAGNDVDTMAALLAQCVRSEYTLHSNTDTYFCESYKYSDGRLVINQRQLVDVDINTASGGIYWGNASLNDYPVEFESMPTVTLSTMTGTINAFIWGNYGTELPSTTNAGKPLLGRGEAASGKVWVCVHSEGRYTVEAAVAEVMNIAEDDIL